MHYFSTKKAKIHLIPHQHKSLTKDICFYGRAKINNIKIAK